MCQFHLLLLCECIWITKNPKIHPPPTNWLKCTDVSEPYPATYIQPPLWCSLHLLLWAGLSLGCVFDLHSFCCGTLCLFKIWRSCSGHAYFRFVQQTGLISHILISQSSISSHYSMSSDVLQGRYTIISIGLNTIPTGWCLPVASQWISRGKHCRVCFSRRGASPADGLWTFGSEQIMRHVVGFVGDNKISWQTAPQTTIELGNVKGPWLYSVQMYVSTRDAVTDQVKRSMGSFFLFNHIRLDHYMDPFLWRFHKVYRTKSYWISA